MLSAGCCWWAKAEAYGSGQVRGMRVLTSLTLMPGHALCLQQQPCIQQTNHPLPATDMLRYSHSMGGMGAPLAASTASSTSFFTSRSTRLISLAS